MADADRLKKTVDSLTKAQIEALVRVRDRGSLAWCAGLGRAGGAVSRMFERMAEQGLVTRVPYEVTKLGADVLRAGGY